MFKIFAYKRIAVSLFILFSAVEPSSAQSLKQIINRGLQSHPSINTQKLRIIGGESDVTTANWQYYPTLSLELDSNDNSNTFPERTFSDLFDNFDAGSSLTVSVEQPLWTGGRLSGSLAQARGSLKEMQEGLGQAQRELTLSIVQVYGEWVDVHLKIAAWEESLKTHIELQNTVDRRFEEGLASSSDQMLAVSRLDSVTFDLTSSQAQERVALSALAQLVGRDIQSNDLIVDLSLPVLEQNLSTMVSQALQLSPAVQQALAVTDTAAANVSIQKAQRLPSVFLRLEHEVGAKGANRNSFTDSRIFIGVRTTFGAGLSALSAIDSSRSAYQASIVQVDVERRAIQQSVEGAYYLVSSFPAQQESLKRAAIATEEVYNSYNRQFFAGRKTWLDLLNSERDLTQSKMQMVNAQAANLVVTWRLAILTQSLESLLEFNMEGDTALPTDSTSTGED